MRPSVQLYSRLLTRYLRPQIGQTSLLLLVLCANILLQLINPLIMRRFLDSALAGGSDRCAQVGPRRGCRQVAAVAGTLPGNAQPVGGSRRG